METTQKEQVPFAVWGFIKLIIRDNDRQKEINALTVIASSQSESLQELKNMLLEINKQTQEFEYQTILMRESNEIFKEHLTIISSAIKHDQEIKGNLIELDAKKRKSEIRPHFMFVKAMGHGSSGSYEMRLRNIGQTAYIKDIIVPDDCLINFYKDFSDDKIVKQNEEINIRGQIKDNSSSVNVTDFEFEILFIDVDNNSYKQKIRRFDNGISYKVENPQAVE